MTQIYVANPTDQYRVLHYRLIEANRPFQQPIDSGRQVRIPVDLNVPQVENLLEQFSKYNIVNMKDVGGYKGRHMIPLIYSMDAPVPRPMIELARQINNGMARAIGKETRKAAAVAAAHQIAEVDPAAAKTLEVAVTEEKAGTLLRDDPASVPMSENISITDGEEATSDQPPPALIERGARPGGGRRGRN